MSIHGRNLLAETVDYLDQYDKSPKDVKFVMTSYDPIRQKTDAVGSWEDFAKLADFEYDYGYGSYEINLQLLIVGEDWWLERHEYDGSEWWEFKTLPKATLNMRKLTLGDIRED